MYKLSSVFAKLIPSLMLGVSGVLCGYIHPESGCYSLQGELLFLYPALGDTYFVVNSVGSGTTTINGDRIANVMGFNPAFRVEGMYGLSSLGQDLRINWTYLHANHFKQIIGRQLFPTAEFMATGGIPSPYSGQASSTLDVIYQNLEALFEQKVFDYNFAQAYLQLGIQYSYIRVNNDIDYISGSTNELLDYKTRMWGVGPEFGLEGRWDFYSCEGYIPGNVSLVAGSSAAFLVSNAKSQLPVKQGATNYLVEDKSIWRAVPFVHFFAGFNYLTCFYRYPVAIEIGYEFSYFNRAVSQIRFTDDVDRTASFNYYQNITFHGPYVSAGMTF